MPIIPDPERNIVLAIVAQNENQALRSISEGYSNWLAGRGYNQVIIDMFKPTGAEELLAHLSQKKVAFAYAFAGVGSQLTFTNGVNIWTGSRTPFIAFWHDHPAYNYRQHIVDSPYVGNLYHIADHLKAREQFLPKCKSSFRFAEMTYHVVDPSQRTSMRDRRREIYYVKTGCNPQIIANNWQDHPKKLQDILWELVGQAQRNHAIDLTSATAALLTVNGHNIANLDMFMGIVAEVDNYIRAWRSDRLARALLPHPAVIVGRGWDYLSSEPAMAKFAPPVPFDEYLRGIRDFRITANSNPLWVDGVHERANLGIRYGSITLTDSTQRSDHLFNALPNYVPFDWNNNLEEKIAEALRLSDDLDADYFTPAEQHLKGLSPEQDYITIVENFAEDIRAQSLF